MSEQRDKAIKAIKEIGREMQAVSVSLDGQRMSLVDAVYRDTQNFPVYSVMSLEERRELVRAVWEYAVGSIAWDGARGTYADATVEQFIKKNDL